MSHYTMLSKYGNCTRLPKIKNKLNKELFFILNVRLKPFVFGTQRNVVVVVYIIYVY